MARPFEEMSYPAMSSMASQTILDDYKSSKRDKKHRPRIPKIKSSGEDGPLAAARSNHERQKKAAGTPTSPTFVPDYLLESSGTSLPSAHANPEKRSKPKIKPLLRKFSSQEHVGIDLSRSAAENEGFSIYQQSSTTIPVRTPSGSQRRGFHNRTTSGTSNMSTTTTSSHQYGTPYVHPMRQTPHSPPVAASYKNSLESNEEPLPHPPPSRRKHMPTPLHVRTGSSFTNSSQVNLPGTPSSLRFPTDPDMISPATGRSGRSSLESAFRKTRSRSNTAQTDPTQQAISVQQMRQKFQEKEAAKDRKYAEQEKKAQEKEQKKQNKKTRSRAASEKSSLVGIAYGTAGAQSREAFPTYSHGAPKTFDAPPTLGRNRGGTDESAGKKVQSQWTLFWIKVRTMLLNLRRKMGGSEKK